MKLNKGLSLVLFVFTLSAIVFNSTNTQAQNGSPKFTNISVAEGLSQSTVFAIAQDSKGFMWFGTRTGGLNRYDGRSFKIYKHNFNDPHSISGNEILTIFEDSRGRIWIGTRGFGLNRFDYEKELFYNYLNDDTPNDVKDFKTVNSVVEDYKGRVWIATLGGICLYDEQSDSFSVIPNPTSSNSSICLVRDSLLCVGNKSGAYLLNTNSQKIVRSFKYRADNPQTISSNRVTALKYDSKDRLWIGTRNDGLNLLRDLSNSNFVRFQHDPADDQSISNNIIRVIAEDQFGTMWIGTSDGLNQFTSDQIEENKPSFVHHKNDVENKSSLSQNVIFSFLEDQDKNLWIGTWSRGVDYLNIHNKKFEHYRYDIDKSKGLYHDNVTSFTENNQGIWVGTDNGGVSLLDRDRNKFIQHIRAAENLEIIKNDHIRSLFADTDNSIWIGTFDGLTHYNPVSEISEYFFENQAINSITNGVDNELWIGGVNGLFRLNKKSKALKVYKRNDSDETSLSDNNVNFIHLESNNNLWVGTKRGLHLYDRDADNFVRFNHSTRDPKSLSNDHIVTMANDQQGNLWIGTYDGLNKFQRADSSFLHFSESDGLPDNVINGIVPGGRGEIWLSTNHGLVEFFYLPEAQSDTVQVRLFTEEDGLQNNEFIRHAQFKTKKGEILFGGLNGFNLFHPDSIKSNLVPPRTSLTGLKLFNQLVQVDDDSKLLDKNIALTNEVTLNPKQSIVTFCFAALSFTSPKKNKFAFKLEGLEENWNYVGNQNEATYTSLPAGDYVFRVKACNNDGIWDEAGTAVNVYVLPPWWKTWWARVIWGVILILAVYIIIRVRTNYLRNQSKILKKMVKQSVKELEEKNERIALQSAELHAYNDSLEKTVALRTEQLTERNKKLAEYAFMNAHNLRVPVANIKGIIQLFESDRSKPEILEYIEMLRGQSDNLDKVLLDIQQMLEDDEFLLDHYHSEKDD